jgi:hypothetical protein
VLIVHAGLRQAGYKLPTILEFIDRKTPPWLANLLFIPKVKERLESSSYLTIELPYGWVQPRGVSKNNRNIVENLSEKKRYVIGKEA